MAGYRKKKNRSGFEVNFYTIDRQRKSIWLQGASQRQARDFVRHLEELLRSQKAGVAPEADTAKWADELDGPLRDKLVSFGLTEAATHRRYEPHERTVGAWTEAFIKANTTTTRTASNYEQARAWLLKEVDASRDLASVTPDDLRRWQRNMKGKLALSSRNKHLQRVRTMFRSAVEAKIIRTNPATAIKQERHPEGRRVDRSRQYFVDPQLSKQVVDGLQDTKWKLIFALLRYQGMRRHEALALEWSQVNFENGTLQTKSLKTGIRECPIFAETRQYLDQMANEAGELKGKVIPWATEVDSLTPLLAKRIKAILGFVWPKTCQQLRSTRRTELDECFPAHVVNEWLGHSGDTAERHYRQVTNGHHAKAIAMPNTCSAPGSTDQASLTKTEADSPKEMVISSTNTTHSADPSWGYLFFVTPFFVR